ncbi:MAG: hypothetical protein FWG64_05645 [Firmicutes bacterium]|nr:hypothetical protein [Bacillota bacterium]
MKKFGNVNVNQNYLEPLILEKDFPFELEYKKFIDKDKTTRYKDPDSNSLELYADLATLLADRQLPNGKMLKIKKIKQRKNGDNFYLELCVYIHNKANEYTNFGITSDFISSSTFSAIKANVSATRIKESLKITRSIGGHVVWAIWKLPNNPNKIESINQARGEECGLYDRFDLTLFHLKNWYEEKPCFLKKVFDSNENWLNLFVDFNGFINFFYLNSFVFDDTVQNITGIRNLTCDWNENQILSDGTPCIPKTAKDYIIYMNSNEKAIQERNTKINKFFN